MQAGTLGLLNENTRSFGLYYGDPESVPAEELRSAACVTVAESDIAKIESDVYALQQIPKGQYATLLFKGPYPEIKAAYSWMFGEWLPNSGLQMGDFPPMEEYLNDPKETAPEELLTRIHCLIKAV
jgi:AraC family transcriptional regulator